MDVAIIVIITFVAFLLLIIVIIRLASLLDCCRCLDIPTESMEQLAGAVDSDSFNDDDDDEDEEDICYYRDFLPNDSLNPYLQQECDADTPRQNDRSHYNHNGLQSQVSLSNSIVNTVLVDVNVKGNYSDVYSPKPHLSPDNRSSAIDVGSHQLRGNVKLNRAIGNNEEFLYKTFVPPYPTTCFDPQRRKVNGELSSGSGTSRHPMQRRIRFKTPLDNASTSSIPDYLTDDAYNEDSTVDHVTALAMQGTMSRNSQPLDLNGTCFNQVDSTTGAHIPLSGIAQGSRLPAATYRIPKESHF